jgi:hypothetical protein
MPSAFQWTDERDALLRARCSDGVSARKIGAELGTSDATVRRRMRHLGITADRTRTEAATQAAVVDVKARRAAVAQRMVGQAEKILDRLEAPTYTALIRGGFGAEEEKTLEQPPARDHRELMSAAQIAMQTALRIDEHDADGGYGEVAGALEAVANAFAAVAGGIGRLDVEEVTPEDWTPEPDPEGGDAA